MATILITGDDFASIDRVRGVTESLGHAVLHAVTTENVIEDVTLNEVALILVSKNTRPFTEWEVCEMLRADPTIPADLAIVLLHTGDFDHRRFSNSRFSGHLNADMAAPLLSEEIIRHLGKNAAPESTDPLAHSEFD